MIDYFSNHSRLISNISQCEIARTGALKGIHVAACGLKSIELTSDTVKILGVYFSYNKKNSERKKILQKSSRHSKYSQIIDA